jgi:hypothetical protein
LFGTWLNNQPKKMKGLIWVGTATLCWAIWRCNDVIFKKLKTNSIICRLFSGEHTGYAPGPNYSVMSRPRTPSLR